MTAGELEVELGCYQMYFNDGCDIHNLSMEEMAEFITLRDALPELLDDIEDV
jgi:hypothetical protein